MDLHFVYLPRLLFLGDLPHILDRSSAHRKALYAVLPYGIARRHNSNQAAAIKVHNTFGLPVLLSGVAALTLSTNELKDLINTL